VFWREIAMGMKWIGTDVLVEEIYPPMAGLYVECARDTTID